MKLLRLVLMAGIAATALNLSAEVTGPWADLGFAKDGMWTKSQTTFRLAKPIGSVESGYVYTNGIGRVHQFCFSANLKASREDAIKKVRETEAAFGNVIKLSAFAPHVDGENPDRYLFSEEADLVDYPHWNMRVYIEKGKRPGECALKMSIWNAEISSTSRNRLDERQVRCLLLESGWSEECARRMAERYAYEIAIVRQCKGLGRFTGRRQNARG